MMLAPAAPFDHCTVPLQFDAVKVTLPPLQIVVDGLAVTVGAASGVTVMV